MSLHLICSVVGADVIEHVMCTGSNDGLYSLPKGFTDGSSIPSPHIPSVIRFHHVDYGACFGTNERSDMVNTSKHWLPHALPHSNICLRIFQKIARSMLVAISLVTLGQQ